MPREFIPPAAPTSAPSPAPAQTNASGNTSAAPDAAARDAAPAVAARPPSDDPQRLMGLDEDALRRELGQPSFMRRDVPALLWRYAASGCTLDIFLYRKGSGGPFTVTHLAARSTNGAPSAVTPASGAEINPRACLGAVLRARQGTPTG